MAHQLIIDPRCVTCGNCEAWLPGLMEHIPMGRMPIDQTMGDVAIRTAIDRCPLDALSLEEVDNV
ncbi:MAG: hypothetical protein WCZ86_05895 [Desulfurivibrionaceae bacterium]|jgi:ferredoxin